MAGRLAAELAKAPQLVERQVIAREAQQRVQQHRRMAIAEHESVPVGPLWIGRVVAQMPAPQHGGEVGHAKRRAGVAALGLLDGIGSEQAHGAGHALKLRLIERLGGGSQWCVHTNVFSSRAASDPSSAGSSA
jgi:hypothetical protein